jgi:predicted N-formylglutamate amidohydrolase
MLKPLVQGFLAEGDLFAADVGDNEPYDGALAGDTIDAIATSRGLANALIEIRQDLIGEKEDAVAWGERIARILRYAVANRCSRTPTDFGSRARGSSRGRGKPSSAT